MMLSNYRAFNSKTRINNFIYQIQFEGVSFINDIIIFDICIKKLSSRLSLNIKKLIKIYSKINHKQDYVPKEILKKIEIILQNFMDLNIHIKVDKIYNLLSYIISNKWYFKKNNIILNNLKKKIVELMYTLKDSDIKYYYFLLFNTIYISKEKENIYTKPHVTSFNHNNDDDDLDFYLDNISNYKINIPNYFIFKERTDDIIIMFS